MLKDFRTRPNDRSDRGSPASSRPSRDRPVVREEQPQPASSASSQATTPSKSYQTAEERAAFIKQQAEQRMLERLAALGLKPPSKSGATVVQRDGDNLEERDQRIRQAEEQDAKRDQERQRRIADETPTPPSLVKSTTGKKPPPPPSRGSRLNISGQRGEAGRNAEADSLKQKAEQEGREKAIKEQQEVQEKQRRQLE